MTSIKSKVCRCCLSTRVTPSTGSQASYKKLGDVERRPPGSRVHFCTLCDMPIAVYGRLHPCKHVYCMACVSDMTACTLYVYHHSRFVYDIGAPQVQGLDRTG